MSRYLCRQVISLLGREGIILCSVLLYVISRSLYVFSGVQLIFFDVGCFISPFLLCVCRWLPVLHAQRDVVVLTRMMCSSQLLKSCGGVAAFVESQSWYDRGDNIQKSISWAFRDCNLYICYITMRSQSVSLETFEISLSIVFHLRVLLLEHIFRRFYSTLIVTCLK